MNEVYAKFVGEPFPCRTTVFVGLPPGMLVEIDVLAVVD
jgi:enamine deaminase RidA (YjgF/YER057c/UK114 family)